MKVKDLKKILENLSDDTKIILSKDAEGNDFSPLSDYSIGVYVPDSTWSGEMFHDEDIKDCGLEKEPHSIVLWPVN
jgi:hypothetical protein